MTTASMSLSRALQSVGVDTQLDNNISDVAAAWFAQWLRIRADIELQDGRPDAAQGLIRAAYILETDE